MKAWEAARFPAQEALVVSPGMERNALQKGQFQPELGCSLVLLHEIVLCEDASRFCQLPEIEEPRHLLDLAYLVLGAVKNAGNICPCFRQHQRAPVFSNLDVELTQVSSSL